MKNTNNKTTTVTLAGIEKLSLDYVTIKENYLKVTELPIYTFICSPIFI